jgi:predicted GNAT family acetyltransferase
MALVECMIADARQNGFKIVPLCPYVKRNTVGIRNGLM